MAGPTIRVWWKGGRVGRPSRWVRRRRCEVANTDVVAGTSIGRAGGRGDALLRQAVARQGTGPQRRRCFESTTTGSNRYRLADGDRRAEGDVNGCDLGTGGLWCSGVRVCNGADV